MNQPPLRRALRRLTFDELDELAASVVEVLEETGLGLIEQHSVKSRPIKV